MHLFVSQLSISRYSNSGIGTGSELKKKKKMWIVHPYQILSIFCGSGIVNDMTDPQLLCQ